MKHRIDLGRLLAAGWLLILVIAAFSAGAASEGVAQWLWPLVIIVVAVAQLAFNSAQQRKRKRDADWLRAIIDAVPYMLFYKDAESRYLGVNSMFSGAFEVARSDIVGKRDIDLFGPDLHERFVAQDIALQASGRPKTFEESMVVGGIERVLESRKSPFYDKSGKLLGIVGVAVDVTSQRKQQQELKQANMRLQHALSQLEQSRIDFDLALQAGDLGVWRTEFTNDDLRRRADNLDSTLVEWDASSRRIAGLQVDSPLTKQDVVRLIHPDDRHRLWSAIVSALRQGGGRLSDTGRLVRPDGSIRTVAVRAAVTYWPNADGTGVVRGLTGIFRDITDEEVIKQELERKATEALEAGEAKSRFLAMMSHEIRTPMNGIIGMLELVLTTELSADQRTMLTSVNESALVLLAILNDILDFSKIEAGKLEVEVVPYRLRDVIENARSTWSAKASRKGIRLDLTVAPEVPSCVYGDRVRLHQVLTNLVGNAVKFTERGSVRVTVALGEPIVAGDERKAVRFDVEDTGIGIDSAGQAMLFEPFQQADVSTTRNYGGTGLGLSIVKSLVGAMHGRIECRSTPGSGSVFSVTLPLEAAPDAAAPDAAAPSTPSHTGNALVRDRETEERLGRLVLVAEDNALNREVIARQLEYLGYCCDMAEDGEVAWAKLTSGTRYGLLLVDGHMPKLDGYQLVERIRFREERGCGERLPIVAITANALVGERERCLSLGMDGYLSKPILIGSLDGLMRQYLPEKNRRANQVYPSRDHGPADERVDLEGHMLFVPLQELARNDAQQYLRLLGLFEQTAREDLTALAKAGRNDDWGEIRDLAHRLKSTFAQAGDDASAMLFASLEHMHDIDAERYKVLDAANERAAITLSHARACLPQFSR